METLENIVIPSRSLRTVRESNGIKLSEAARKLGISRQRLHAYEKGEYMVSAEILARMCVLYSVPVQAFIAA